MRLYSRGQLALVGLGGIALALALVFGLGLARLPERSGSPLPRASAEAAAEQGPDPVEAQGGKPAALETRDLILAESFGAEYSVDERENIDVYERFNAAVVNITTEVVAINWFYEPVPQEGGTGSGSIIDARGYVLTNNHVVKDATKIFVNLADGGRYQAEVVGVDPENDLAVIKFDPPKDQRLTVIPYGDSSRLKVGQKLLAIGNPFGLDRTLTRGIVSALGRPIVQQDERTGRQIMIQGMIQTDASINPGNSGGPLLNSRGEMIGVNTMIYSPSKGSVGIGFAVPVNTAKRIVPELIKEGRVRRGWIDIVPVQLFPELVEYMRQNGYAAPVAQGLLISKTPKGGNADRAGMRGGDTAVRYGRSTFFVGGDIVSAVNGAKIATITDLYTALENTKPGDRAEVEYYRNGRKLSAQVQLSDRAKAGVSD
ncbi:MAG TPA: trypsin-like peptidase domain-containing protein [Spirochaetia bacterium]|nr:trypsin-like peptidase domain-containing protein [Spirochaetia bacterium]